MKILEHWFPPLPSSAFIFLNPDNVVFVYEGPKKMENGVPQRKKWKVEKGSKLQIRALPNNKIIYLCQMYLPKLSKI